MVAGGKKIAFLKKKKKNFSQDREKLLGCGWIAHIY